MSYWQVCIQKKKKKQVPSSRTCQDKLSLPVSTNATPRREAMKGNNNYLESWQFTACWLDTSDGAFFAEIKTLCFHVGLKTRFRRFDPCTVAENTSFNFYTLIQQSIYTISVLTALHLLHLLLQVWLLITKGKCLLGLIKILHFKFSIYMWKYNWRVWYHNEIIITLFV